MMGPALLLLSMLAACTFSAPSLLLTTAEAAPTANPETPEAAFQAAMSTFQSGEFKIAANHFEAARLNLPLLSDYATAYLAKIASRLGEPSQAAKHWQEILKKYDHSVWRSPAALALAQQALKSENHYEARRLLRVAKTGALLREESATALWLEVQIAQAEGDTSAASRISAQVRDLYPESPEARDAQEYVWAIRAEQINSLPKAQTEIRRWLKEFQYDRALTLTRESQTHFSNTQEQSVLTWLESEALRKLGKQLESKALLRKIRRLYPQSNEADEALHRLAMNSWNQDQDATAQKLFTRYARQYPKGPHAAASLLAIGRIHSIKGHYKGAIRAFENMLRQYPEDEYSPEARWRIGWAHYRNKNFAAAESSFAGASNSTTWRLPSIYWQARAQEHLKQDPTALYAEILQDTPDDYYAWMAARRLGKKAVVPTSTPHKGLGQLPADNGVIQLKRFNLLAQLGLPDLARRELQGSYKLLPLKTRLVALVAINGFHEALRAAYVESRCRLTHQLAAFCFPRAYWATVQHESQRHQVDPDLVLSLMRQESQFKTQALSPANARGLMQLMPKTAETIGSAIGLHDYSLFSPADNIALGVAYLGKLSVLYQGDIFRMLSAYNAGPRAVARWEQRFPDAEDDEFVETISYRETRKYVKQVIRHRLIYESMYQPKLDTSISD